MRRALIPVILLICLSSLVARPTLVLEARGGEPGYAHLMAVVERVANHSLLSRMGGEGELFITISDLVEPRENALSATVLFTYGERTLQLCLRSEANDARHLEERLSSMLLYDGMDLFEVEASLVVAHTYDQGYASLSPLHKGDSYKGLDAEGGTWATVVVRRVLADEEAPVSLLVSTSGKKLLPGMKLEKQAGKSASLSISSLLGTRPDSLISLEGLYGQDVGLYPLTLVLGGGFDVAGSTVDTVYGQVGLNVRFPLSMAFGLHAGFWRNSSVAMGCTLGLGYALDDGPMLYGSGAVFSYRYQGQVVGIDIGVGTKHWASDLKSYSSGLFMQLGLAYTW